MDPVFFADQSEFRKWLEKNHNRVSELIVGFYKTTSGKPSITWSQSVDEALCFGWIDGIRRNIDHVSYSIRFTPRNPRSNWSEINIKKAEGLIRQGLMRDDGLKLFNNRNTDKKKLYSYENKPENLPLEFENTFKSNVNGWEYFSKQAVSYKKTIYFWILSAKQENTRLSRLSKVITESEKQRRIF